MKQHEFDRDGFRLSDVEKEELWRRITPPGRKRPAPRPRLIFALSTGAVAVTLAALVIGHWATRGRTPAPVDLLRVAPPPVVESDRGAAPVSQTPAPAPDLATKPAHRPDLAAGPAPSSGSVAKPSAAPGAPAAPSAPPRDVKDVTGTEPVVAEATPDRAEAEQRITGDQMTKHAIDSVEEALNKQAGATGRPEVNARGGRSGDVSVRTVDRSAGGAPTLAAPSPGALSQASPGQALATVAPRDKRARLEERSAGAPADRLEPALVGREHEVARERERLEYEREFRHRCWIPPHDPTFDMMYFQHTGINPFVITSADALSTFGLDVDNASYTMTRAYLERGQLPPAAAVRVEEFVNFFRQDYPPADEGDFRIVVDGMPSPFREGYHLLRVGVRARDVRQSERKPAALTFVIDVSGSMGMENRLGLVKRALGVLLDRLEPSDTVGIVTYTTYAREVLEPTGAARRGLIESVIDELTPQQTTNLDQGLELGYRMARRAFRPGAINRIVLCTDGVANEAITNAEGILDDVRRESDAGIHLTAIGVGMGNYNDKLLETLADKGDGNYYYVDSMDEARRVFGERLTGTLQTVAKDAKIQVEFDPRAVERWRLIGYEKRALADEDFRNDAVDAGEVGAGHQVTALYEVMLAKGSHPGTPWPPDMIEKGVRRWPPSEDDRARLGVVHLRWREPESEGRAAGLPREMERKFSLDDLSPSFERAPKRLRLDATVAQFAEILRDSYWARGGNLREVARLADQVADELPGDEDVQEFARLAQRAAALRDHGPYEKRDDRDDR